MRHLIDTYIVASESRKISDFDDLTLIQLIVERGEAGLLEAKKRAGGTEKAMSEAIENNIRRLIINEQETDPVYFAELSALLDELVAARRDKAISYETWLKKIKDLSQKATSAGAGDAAFPATLKTKAERALFGFFGKNEKAALEANAAILSARKDGWRGNRVKELKIRNAVAALVADEKQAEKLFELIKNQIEY